MQIRDTERERESERDREREGGETGREGKKERGRERDIEIDRIQKCGTYWRRKLHSSTKKVKLLR